MRDKSENRCRGRIALLQLKTRLVILLVVAGDPRMANSVHYEVFRRQGAAGSWSLADVRDRREDALKFAQELQTTGAMGVKVVKETYNDETGDYLSLKIYEHGHNKLKVKPQQEDAPSSPCFKPDDLYSYHARKTIASLLPDFLAHHKVTVTELGHRADLLEKLEATGTLLQHAIQRVAVAQAAAGENQLAKIIRSLHDLTTQIFHRVYKDHDKGRFAVCLPGEFAQLATKLAGSSDGRYLLNGAIAHYLKDSKGWDNKVHKLMLLMDEAQEENAGGQLLLGAIDTLISEVLGGAAGLRELIGAKTNHGDAVMSLVKLFLGKEPDFAEGREGLTALTQQFRADTLPNARVAVALRIVAEIRSFKRLMPHSLEEELRTLRQIANLVVTGIGKYLSHEDLVNAFVLRSQRLVTNECLAPYLDGVTPDVKLERILFVEENIIGTENKRRLAAFVTPIVTSAQFEEHFQSPKLPLVQRLAQIEALRIRVGQAGFQENLRNEIADILDKVAAAVENRNKLFDSIERRNVSPSEKAFTLIRLLNANTLTTPRLTTKARAMILSYVGKPGFLTSYVAQTVKDGALPDREAAIADLMRILEKAGITAQTGLKSIAA